MTEHDFQVNPMEFPSVTLNIERMSGVDFEGQAEVNFLTNPFTVKNACKILRDELLKHEDLYIAFSASIFSALNDMPDGLDAIDTADFILNRIIGEEYSGNI